MQVKPHPPSSGTPPALVAAAGVPAVSRALTLLDRLAEQRAPMSLARLAADLALPKSSVHGLCNTLVSFGYLRRQTDGAFLIGPRVLTLAEAFVASTSVTREFEALWARDAAPEETMILSVLAGADVLYVAVRNGARPLGLSFSVGMRLPAHLSATGQAQLAFVPPADVARLLAPGGTAAARASTVLSRLTPHGSANLGALRKALQATRERGYAVDDEGIREGVVGIAAPVFDATGKVVAGLGVCLHKPTLRAAREARQRAVVLAAAQTLTERLGGRAGSGLSSESEGA